MQLAPSDFQAWAAATGSEYPATPADKAAVYNDVAAWKASQQAAATQSRGSNAISPLAVGAGTAGLGLAGLLAFNHFRKQGLSEPAAAQLAKNAENQAATTATAVQTPPAAPPPPAATPNYRLVDTDDQNVRPARTGGPTLRADYEAGPTAATQEIRGGRSLGGSLAREQGQYKARTDEGFHNPVLQGLDTPQKRNIYLAGVADAHGTDSAEFQQAQKLIAALETTTGPGVEPTSFIAGLSPRQRYGTATAAEESANALEGGSTLQLGRRNSGAMFQPGWFPDSLILDDNGMPLQADDIGNLYLDDHTEPPKPGAETERSLAEALLKQERQAQAAQLIADGNDEEAARLLALGSNIRNSNTGNRESKSDFRVKYATDANGKVVLDANGFPVPAKGPNGEDVFIYDPQGLRQNLSKIYAEPEDAATTGLMEGLPGGRSTRVGLPKNAIPDAAGTSDQFYGFKTMVGNEYKLGSNTYRGNIFDLEVGGNQFSYTDRRSKNFFNRDGTSRLVTEIGSADDKAGWYSEVPLVKGLSLLTPGTSFTQADNAWYPVVPAAESTDAYQALKANYHQQPDAPAVLSPGHEETLRNHSSVLAEQQAKTQYFDLNGNSLALPAIYNKEAPIPRAIKKDGKWVAPLRLVLSRNSDGSVLFNSRPATATDLLVHRENIRGPRGLYFGKTAREAASAQQAPFQDYSKPGLFDRDVYIDQRPDIHAEMESPAWAAGGRLKMAMDDHLARSGRPVPEPVAIQWATSLGQEHGVDAASVLRVALGRKPAGPVQGPKRQARALAAGSGDALDRVYNSLGMHAGADAWDLEGKVRSGDLKGAAAALASQLPSLTAVNASGLRGVGQDEKLNIVAEGISAGLNDLHVAVNKYPEAASKFGIGTGPGGFGLDAFLKSYVRDWVTVRGLQIDPTGQPTYQVPNDAFEILAHQAHENGHSTLHEVENHVRGAANGLEGALRLDRLVSAAQSTKEGDPNTNGTNFAQVVFDLKDKDLISTQLTNEAAGDVKLSFGTRRNYDATAGFYDRNPNEQQLDDAIDSYTAHRVDVDGSGSFADADAGYKPNAVLAARISGADFKTPEGQLQQQRAKDTQAWITANATDLERQRADFNRGIILGDSGPQSFGRGFVISSDHRGAFLAGDTQGMNTSIREEQFNDGDTTAVDRAQDHEREARLSNQIVEPDGLDVADSLHAVSTSEADATASQYGGTKLNFKNLGPGSRGAMADGEAFYPRQALRRQAAESASDSALNRILAAHLPSFRFAVQGAAPGYGDDYERFSPTPPAPAGAEERQAAIDLDRRTLQHSTAAPYATVMPKGWRPDFNDRNIRIGVTSAARPSITTTGAAAVVAARDAAAQARAVNGGEGFSDDQKFRDAQLLDAGEFGGFGRRGSTFAQAPIAATPVSAIPAAAMEQLNTLRSSLERSVPAPITDHEREVARVGHHADYLDKLYALPPGKTPNANLQPVLVGSNRPTPYAEPGEGLLTARVNALRKRGIL